MKIICPLVVEPLISLIMILFYSFYSVFFYLFDAIIYVGKLFLFILASVENWIFFIVYLVILVLHFISVDYTFFSVFLRPFTIYNEIQ